MRNFVVAIGTGLAAAAIALLAPFAMQDSSELAVQIVLIGAQVAWIATTVWCVYAFGKKGLWLLASAPFALAWPWAILLYLTIRCGLASCGD